MNCEQPSFACPGDAGQANVRALVKDNLCNWDEYEYTDEEEVCAPIKVLRDGKDDESECCTLTKKQRCDELERENEILKIENGKLMESIRQLTRHHANAKYIFSGISNSFPEAGIGRACEYNLSTEGGVLSTHLKLKQVFYSDTGEIDTLNNFDSNVRFRKHKSFPHAIEIIGNAGERIYHTESRRAMHIKFRLVRKSDEGKALEHELRPDGNLPFKMEIVYADAPHVRVSKDDFSRFNMHGLTIPTISHIGTQNMINGEVTFNFKLCCTSYDTTPKNREFVVRISPATGDEIDNIPELNASTPAFTNKSKISVRSEESSESED